MEKIKKETMIEKLRRKRLPITDECKADKGCDKIETVDGKEFCKSYAFPKTRWKLGPCVLASHVTREGEKTDGKVRVGQQKTKRRNR